MTLIFVDCEADLDSPCPGVGLGMTEFGAVEYRTRQTFHGVPTVAEHEYYPELRLWHDTFEQFDQWLKQFPPPYVFVSDNPAYDWQWINYHFWHELHRNPFGHSARRISDFYAGLRGDWWRTQEWKRLRVTKHDHNPVHDAMGNVEAFERLLAGEL